MKKALGRNLALILLGVLFAVWNILVWVCVSYTVGVKEAKLFFYCSYGFITLAFLVAALGILVIRVRKNTIFSVNLPCYLAIGIYFIITFVMDTIFMCFPRGTNVPGIVVPNVILFLLFVALFAVAYFAVAHIGGHNKEIDEKVQKLKISAIEVGQIAALAEDEEVRSALLALREAVEYSDPMGVPQTASYEEEFSKKVSEIRLLVEENCAKESVMGKIKSAKNKLTERNEILRSLK